MRALWRHVRPWVFWSYRRGSWQYDVMVGLILVFVFLTPRRWFRDQPRIPSPQQIVMLPSEGGRSVFLVDPDLIGDLPPDRLPAHIVSLLEKRTGKKVTVVKVEQARDSEGELKGYLVQAEL